MIFIVNLFQDETLVKSRPGKTPGGPQMICMNTYSMPFGFYHFESQLAI